MREYLLKITGIFFITGAGELLLPDGNIKKYAKVLLSILICHTLLTPAGVIPEFKIDTVTEEGKVYDTFEGEVYSEYRKRIEENIYENTGCICEVILDEEGNIEKVITEKETEQNAAEYIVRELGVKRNDIEVRKN